jgi:aminopeptidase N
MRNSSFSPRAAWFLLFAASIALSCRGQAAPGAQNAEAPNSAAQPTPQPAVQETPKSPQPAPAPEAPSRRPPAPNDISAPVPTRYDMLRGAYGPFRANNDLLYYHLDIRVDPEKKFISGKNTIRFRMLKDSTRIQIDLTDKLDIDKILFGQTPLQYTRDSGAVFIDFPQTLRAGQVYSIDFYYSGHPPEVGRFGAFTFKHDPAGRVWINTACEGTGASIWWPDKDQWRDEVESMDISVAIPNGLVDVSNGKFVGKTDLGDGYTRWDWHVSYPINNYDVSLNIGDYVHWHEDRISDKTGNLSLDFYVLPEDLDKAKKQFAQVSGMLDAYQHYFGPYPFARDGYKLIEAPYSGMEHQSAVTYGNLFENGYLGRDWTHTGISLRFDFIIIHESAHEWFGNSITAADPSDMWIHEGWATYLESLYVEYRWGKNDAITYLNGLKPKIYNLHPIVAERGVNADPTEDQYFKGALMLNTLRSVIDDDAKWFALIHDFYQHFKYQNILTEDVVAYFNQQTGMNLTPIFNQYLRHADIPRLELLFGEAPGPNTHLVMYKWDADEDDFAMPVRVGAPDHWQIIHPTTKWQWMQSPLSKDEFQVATDLYYVDVNKQ